MSKWLLRMPPSGVLIYKTVSDHLVNRGQSKKKSMGQIIIIRSKFNYLLFFVGQKLLNIILLLFFKFKEIQEINGNIFGFKKIRNKQILTK